MAVEQPDDEAGAAEDAEQKTANNLGCGVMAAASKDVPKKGKLVPGQPVAKGQPPRSRQTGIDADGAVVVDEKPAPTLSAFNPMRPATPKTLEQALLLENGAALKRAIGKAMIEEDGDHIGGRFELAEAEGMEAAASAFMDVGSHVTGPVSIGNGGEVIVATQEAFASIPGVIDTVRESQDMLTAGASRQRLELTGNTLALALDTAGSIQPKNSLEKMRAHQMAAGHRLGMMFANQASDLLGRYAFNSGNHVLSVEAARLANASAKMMAAFQDGTLALDRVRRGGRQTVKVAHQHVAVGAGGQAVVNGSVKTGGRKAGGKARNGR